MSVRQCANLLVLLVFAGLLVIGPVRQVEASLMAAADPAHEKEAAKDHDKTSDGEAHEDHSGPPMGFQKDLALWSLITFLVFLFVLRKLVWTPLVNGLDQREGKIRQDIADAESARIKSEQMLVAHQQKLDQVQDEVKEILAEARRDADQARQNIVEAAKTEAEATKQRAVVDIERARDQALNELFDAMAGQVASATEYVLSNGLKPADQDKLIQQALTQIGQSN